jgi:hypothetical protein
MLVSPTIRRLDDDSTDGRERLCEAPARLYAYDRTQALSRDRTRGDLTMRLPIPTNRLVAFTLAGAFLTAMLALALGAPVGGLASPDDPTTGDSTPTNAQPSGDAPTPNQNFTPAVQTQSGDEEEHEEYEEHEEAEHEEADEDEEEWFGDDD